MPLIIIIGILAVCGAAGAAGADRHKHYTHKDTENMLIEMTGKSKRECRKILKRYGRK
ncbi:hypothetical protein [Ruminococcus sp. YE282]|jgi:hypothetical protein|uniref:hypothetical protein n=1 Tax=Ruminococcus sp. YE282 TaxID=3158780 RepID=UPI00088CF772|nr:hypothetical protein SAMN02910441_00165 [Ruminococcus bromii]